MFLPRADSESRANAHVRSNVQKIQTWRNSSSLDINDVARLLLDFKVIAADELQYTNIEVPTTPMVVPRIAALFPTRAWEDGPSDTEEDDDEDLPSLKRIRTVSVSYDEAPTSPLPSSPFSDYGAAAGSPRNLTFERGSVPITPETRKEVIDMPADLKQMQSILHRPSPSKLVGTTVKVPVKATLQRKFSWKNYPALESYLVRHRDEYLQYSSALNYTAEQKRYNNQLTQGLLDLAEKEGYLFEDFTFAAIRDRIRCYYKSYVQATKKKKKRKRGGF